MNRLCIAVFAGLASIVSSSAFACPDQAAQDDPAKVGAVRTEPNRAEIAANKSVTPATPVRWDAVDQRAIDKAKETASKNPLPADTPNEKPAKQR